MNQEIIDYKAKLQIILQKSKNKLPTYITKTIGVTQPLEYTSTINFTYNNIEQIEEDKNNLHLSKQKAEQFVAHCALNIIKNQCSQKYIIKKNNNFNHIFILIDYENFNISDEIDDLKQNNKHIDNIDIIKFASSHNPLSEKADIVVNSTRRDACDVKIICEVSKIFLTNKKPSTPLELFFIKEQISRW